MPRARLRDSKAARAQRRRRPRFPFRVSRVASDERAPNRERQATWKTPSYPGGDRPKYDRTTKMKVRPPGSDEETLDGDDIPEAD